MRLHARCALVVAAVLAACSGPSPSGPLDPPPPPPPLTGWQGERLGAAFEVFETAATDESWYAISLELGGDGAPLAGYSHAGSRSPAVARWDGAAWPTLGTPPAGADPSALTAVARTSEGEPVVAWVEANAEYDELRAARWSGGAWVPMGGVLSAPSASWIFGLGAASGPLGPVLVWVESTPWSALRVARWDGAAWESLPARTEDGNYAVPSLALTPAGDPVIAVLTTGAAGHVLVRWDAGTSAWVALPAFALPESTEGLDLAIDGDGATYLAAVVRPSLSATVDAVHRLAPGDAAWTPVGVPPRLGSVWSKFALGGLPGGGVAAGWMYLYPELARWKDGAWETVGTYGETTQGLESRPLVLAASDDDLYFAFASIGAAAPTMKVVRYRKY